MTDRSRHGAFALGYGALERTIAELAGTDAEAVRVRFRKLRLRPFPEGIRTGTGVRVSYDLARSLAVATFFELNALSLPLGSAASVVERAWPEICRAAICAAADLGLMVRPAAAPSDATSVVTLLPDAFALGASAEVVAARVDDRLVRSGSAIRIDVRRAVAALTSGDVGHGDAGAAFVGLDETFGWTSDPAIADRRGGDGFMADGPYFARADALLATTIPVDRADVASSSDRMQAIVDYLAQPAPIDAWKGAVGIEGDPLSLWHRLLAFAIGRGLDARLPASIIAAATEEEPGTTARDLIRRARTASARRSG